MKNATQKQKKMADALSQQEAEVTIRWSEVRGVAGVVMGRVLNWLSDETPEQLFTRFLEKLGLLFGPENVIENCEYVGSEERKRGYVRIRAVQKAQGLPIYGATLILFADHERGVFRVQSGFYREVEVPPARLGSRPVDFSARAAGLAKRLKKRLESDPEGARLSRRMAAERAMPAGEGDPSQGPEFPLVTPPKLWLYPTKVGLRQAFKTAALQPIQWSDPSGRTHKSVDVADMVIDARSGRIIEESSRLGMAYTDTTGDGLSTLEDNSGTHFTRQLLVVQEDGNDFLLINRTNTPDIITHDAEGSEAGLTNKFINNTGISRDTNGHWNQTTYSCTTADRVASQQPEVDGHFYADQAWQFYHDLGWDGFDDGGWGAHCPVRVAAHIGIDANAHFWRYIDGNGKHWGYIAFYDGECSGGNIQFDFMAGDPSIFAHEYQHAITYFGARDSGNDPGYLDTSGWHRAIHEGLSDTTAGLRTGRWATPGLWRDGVTRGGKPFRRIEFPRSTDTNRSKAYCDHYDDQNPAGDAYYNSTILSHAAFLAGQGGVHQRISRAAELIPVMGVGNERVAEIFHYALTEYFDNIPANHTDGHTMIEAANFVLDAAEVVSGSKRTCEYVMLRRAFYAVGLNPYNEDYGKASYGGEACMLPWTIAWKHSQPYLGFPAQWYRSPDLFINNGSGVQYDAVAGQENMLFARVRNVGDGDLNNVKVRFYYRAYGTNLPNSSTQWKSCEDQSGADCVLNIPILAAGSMNFTNAHTPPASQAVNWYLDPAEIVEGMDHFCLRAVIECTAPNHDNDCSNLVQSNVSYSYLTWHASREFSFLVANWERKPLPLELEIEHTLPKGIKLEPKEHIVPEQVILAPRSKRKLTWQIKMPDREPKLLLPPFEGQVAGKVTGNDLDGKFFGTLGEVRTFKRPTTPHTPPKMIKIQGQLSGSMGSKLRITGLFEGELDKETAELTGSLLGDLYRATRKKPLKGVKLKFKGVLEPLYGIHFTQRLRGKTVGGVTINLKPPLLPNQRRMPYAR
jgi:Zn-dependent metalloprotease